jgi:aspartate racemase
LLVVVCNTAGVFWEELCTAVHVPLVNWVEEVVTAIVSRRPDVRRVGLLASLGTIRTRMYDDAFAKRGIEIAALVASEEERLMRAIYDYVKTGGRDVEVARGHVDVVAANVIARGADLVLVGCTELSLMFRAHPPQWQIETVDASQVVAERLIVLAGGHLRSEAAERPVASMEA